MIKRIMLFTAVAMVLSIGSMAIAQAPGWEQVASGEEWEPIVRTTWIGVLQGSFYEMGFQYGERAAKDIRANTEIEWPKSVKSCDGSIEEVKRRLGLYREQLELFSPQTVEFLQGMADGAAPQLSKSEIASDATNFERLLNLNTSSALRSPPEEGCDSFWVGAQATVDGKAIATYHGQGGSMGFDRWGRYSVFVAIPDDPDAHIVWMATGSGCLGRGGAIANDAGVFNGLHASDSGKYPETKAWGTEYHLFRFHAMFYGDSAEGAAQITTLGTPEYREKTGRKTLLRTRGIVLQFADANTCLMVEYTANRYAIRRPGNLGEIGAGYICQSNHNHLDYSYDENNGRTDVPMTKFAPEVPEESSYWRFWSPMWAIRNNYGKIDLDMVLNELSALHDRYDKDGNKYEYKRGSTFCTHKYSSSSGNPGGSHAPAVMVPDTLEIYFVPAWPCRWTDKNWNYVNLNTYKALRQK